LQKIAETVARCMSSAKLVRIPEATHWLQHPYAQAFNEAALTFLEGHAK
jgi:pimeloyl-ACP methyl ester carboxylesterase